MVKGSKECPRERLEERGVKLLERKDGDDLLLDQGDDLGTPGEDEGGILLEEGQEQVEARRGRET